MRRIDYTNQRFGRLVGIKQAGRSGHDLTWLWRCDCGAVKEIIAQNVKRGLTRSCGCYCEEINTKHGLCNSAEYSVWVGMKQRCAKHPHYVSRGIKVCERWQRFENFFADMGPRPSSKHTIDRYPNKNGDYDTFNCRWVIQKEQGWSYTGIPRSVDVRASINSAHPARRLSIDDIRSIRAAEGKINRKELAQQYKVRIDHIRDIQKRRCWKWLD